MSGWIEFGKPDPSGQWVTCPLCQKQIRDLRMAKGSHVAWHQQQGHLPVGASGREPEGAESPRSSP